MLNQRNIEKILGAQLSALMKDSEYSHISVIEGYSHLNDKGRDVMLELVTMLAPKVADYQRKEDKERAEKLMMENIKS